MLGIFSLLIVDLIIQMARGNISKNLWGELIITYSLFIVFLGSCFRYDPKESEKRINNFISNNNINVYIYLSFGFFNIVILYFLVKPYRKYWSIDPLIIIIPLINLTIYWREWKALPSYNEKQRGIFFKLYLTGQLALYIYKHKANNKLTKGLT